MMKKLKLKLDKLKSKVDELNSKVDELKSYLWKKSGKLVICFMILSWIMIMPFIISHEVPQSLEPIVVPYRNLAREMNRISLGLFSWAYDSTGFSEKIPLNDFHQNLSYLSFRRELSENIVLKD